MSRSPVAKTFAEPFGYDLFSVNPGIDVVDALEQASNILGCMHELTITISESEAPGKEVFAVQYLNEMAKALVDASVRGLMGKGGNR